MSALLFLAFAFFAVGQATAIRNKAQTAADSAALAAATGARDAIESDFLEALESGDLDSLEDFLEGEGLDSFSAQEIAESYAVENKGVLVGFSRLEEPPGYDVQVRSQESVGESVIEGTETLHATTNATAVIDSLCFVKEKDGDSIKFTCNGEEVSVDPTDSNFELNLAEFFSVHLSE